MGLNVTHFGPLSISLPVLKILGSDRTLSPSPRAAVCKKEARWCWVNQRLRFDVISCVVKLLWGHNLMTLSQIPAQEHELADVWNTISPIALTPPHYQERYDCERLSPIQLQCTQTLVSFTTAFAYGFYSPCLIYQILNFAFTWYYFCEAVLLLMLLFTYL